MEDRGEKIVNLAREMLRAERSGELQQLTQKPSQPIAIRAIFLAAVISAFGSALATEITYESRRPLDHAERVELSALIYYVARVKASDMEDVKQHMAVELKMPNLDDLTRHDFEMARNYLINRIGSGA